MDDVIKRNEFRVWFVAERLVVLSSVQPE